MTLDPSDLEDAFRVCFVETYRTILVGGGDEPMYLPSADPYVAPHRVIYREDFFASALHEVAHWCLAGAERRTLEDYGYWYSPDGRSPEEQARFERVEVAPQALEWIFSDACEFTFNLSADNLSGGIASTDRFACAVESRKSQFLESGLPDRAARYRAALEELMERRVGRRTEDRAANP